MKKLFYFIPVLLLAACNGTTEELPTELPVGQPTRIDSMHRPVPVDTDSMIEPRTGKPKTSETDTI
jgi:hypothetical protein